MRTIQWIVKLNEEDKMASMENAVGFPKGKIENQLVIIGILESLKQNHINQLNTIFNKTKSNRDKEFEDGTEI